MNNQSGRKRPAIRILLIDDQLIVNAGLSFMFHPARDGIQITGCFSNIDEAILTNPDSFDLIFLELWIKRGDPMGNIEKLKLVFPCKPVIIFTRDVSSEWRMKMYRAGVKAFLIKTAGKKEIKETILRVSYGEIVFSNIYSSRHINEIIENQKEPTYCLTSRQKSVLILLSSGLHLSEIAIQTGTSLSNVVKTLRLARKNFNVTTNAELIKEALRRGILV